MGKDNSITRLARHTMTGVHFPTVAGIFPFVAASRTVLGTPSLAVQLILGVKSLNYEANRSPVTSVI